MAPIHDAVLHPHAEPLERLMLMGADINSYDVFDYMHLAPNGPPGWGPDPDETFRCTPLHHLCYQGFFRLDSEKEDDEHPALMVAVMLEYGADPNLVDDHGRTAICIAIRAGYAGVVRVLCNAGADLSDIDDPQWGVFSVLHGALAIAPEDGAKIVMDMVMNLVLAGAPFSEEEEYGTVLEYAIWRNHRRLWPFLLRRCPPPLTTVRSGSPVNTGPQSALPRLPASMPNPELATPVYRGRRSLPYLRKIDAAGSFQNYERAHLRSLSATFVPKFPRLPAEIVPLIVQFWAHVGDY